MCLKSGMFIFHGWFLHNVRFYDISHNFGFYNCFPKNRFFQILNIRKRKIVKVIASGLIELLLYVFWSFYLQFAPKLDFSCISKHSALRHGNWRVVTAHKWLQFKKASRSSSNLQRMCHIDA